MGIKLSVACSVHVQLAHIPETGSFPTLTVVVWGATNTYSRIRFDLLMFFSPFFLTYMEHSLPFNDTWNIHCYGSPAIYVYDIPDIYLAYMTYLRVGAAQVPPLGF